MAANTITIQLVKPVASEGGEITALTFREPTGADIVNRGYPFDIYQGDDTDIDAKNEQKIRINTRALCALASDLANVPRSTIKSLCVADFQNVISVVSGFFGYGAEANSDIEKK
ncbi:MAG: phage tail assembly protein [Alphaproteobacteria bacterium]|nr:phage tail assembly protein [Alphaproteobacteria bacterium]